VVSSSQRRADTEWREPVLESTAPGSPLARWAFVILGVAILFTVVAVWWMGYWPSRAETDRAIPTLEERVTTTPPLLR
jgi:hypothetical protein